MAAYQVARSIKISAPIETLRTSLIDFKQWSAWSPWLITEPDASIEYSDTQGDVGSSYRWEGKLIGSGNMQIEKIANSRVDMIITFISPFTSKADVTFELESLGDETNVTWSMSGKVPFFLIPMLKKMKAYIGMDYERGLRLLKEYIETGSVSSSVTIEGVITLQSKKYIGIANDCDLKDMSTVMPADFQMVGGFIEENNLPIDGSVFALYNDFDLTNQHASFISAIPIKGDIEVKVDAPFIIGELEGGDFIKATHTGSYPHLGNGWAAAMGYGRAKKIKTSKSPVGIEFYLNDPTTTPANELITEIVLPIK
ncbi:MAG: GyrI-like domain-containing protein [Cocleimonas sp.]|nr:GyrI-like domain-containing protein [Cocleimonas sp.]